jgi:hypothetical protein
METDIVANLFEWASVKEWGNTIGPGPQPAARKTSRNRDHVLLRNTCVDKAVAHRIAQRFKGLETEIPGQENKLRKMRLLR